MENNFELGQVVMTQGVQEAMDSSDGFTEFVWESFQRYTDCDWGDADDDTGDQNDEAVETNSNSILAVYIPADNPAHTIWIITEWDHSVTTILFPSER